MPAILAFFGMFFRPRQTIRTILEEEPDLGIIPLAVMEGVTAVLRESVIHGLHPMPDLIGLQPLLDEIIWYGVGSSPSVMMTAASIFISGGLFGVGMVIVGALLLRYAGILVRSGVIYRETRALLAWSFAPYTIMISVWLVFGLANWEVFRATGFPYGPVNPFEAEPAITLLLLIDYAMRIFCTVLLVIAAVETLKLSVGRVIITVILAFGPPFMLLMYWTGVPLRWIFLS